MHVLFVHPGFPSQFGFLANFLAARLGWQVTFATAVETADMSLPFTRVNYLGNLDREGERYFDLGRLDGFIRHMDAVYKALKGLPQVRPDLVVGHVSFGTLLYLRNLYACPFLGYFEILSQPFWTPEFDVRRDFPQDESI